MATEFTNHTATPVGLWDTSNVYHVAPPLSGSIALEPSESAQETIDILVAAGDGATSPAAEPENITPPAITGDAELGALLTATAGEWDGSPLITYAYAWQRSADGEDDWAAIGATVATYTLVEADEDQFVRCVVTATNVAGSDSEPSNVIGPVVSPE